MGNTTSVIAKSVFGDEGISIIIQGDCFGKKHLAMTALFTLNY